VPPVSVLDSESLQLRVVRPHPLEVGRRHRLLPPPSLRLPAPPPPSPSPPRALPPAARLLVPDRPLLDCSRLLDRPLLTPRPSIASTPCVRAATRVLASPRTRVVTSLSTRVAASLPHWRALSLLVSPVALSCLACYHKHASHAHICAKARTSHTRRTTHVGKV
jgi:hypothetical protein